MRLIIILPLLFSLAVGAQTGYTDSLENSLNTQIDDETRMYTLIELADIYSLSNPDTSLILINQALNLADQIGHVRGKAFCYGIYGTIFSYLGNYTKAIEYNLKSLKLFESTNDQYGVGTAYLNLGSVYGEQGDNSTALSYSIKAKELYEDYAQPYMLSVPLINIGEYYLKLNQLDSARIYTNKAYEIDLKYNDTIGIGYGINNLGLVYSKMGKNHIAKSYYRESLTINEYTNTTTTLCESSLGLAELFKNEEQTDSAIYYAKFSLANAKSGSYPKAILNASDFLADYYKALQLVDSAYFYQTMMVSAKDSLFNQEKVRAVQNLTFLERIRQQELLYASLKLKKQRRSNIQMMAIGTFIIFFFGLTLLISKKKVKISVVRFLGLIGTLLLFEFISLFIGPFIGRITNETPIYMLLIFISIASILAPLHNKLDKVVLVKLLQRRGENIDQD